MLAVQAAGAAEVSRRVDCLPDAVVRWDAAEPDPELRFGASLLPGIVLGPPGESLPVSGSTSVASLGPGGSVVLSFGDILIEDGPGPDFIVFENAFFVGFTPTAPADPYAIFAEPGRVEVSWDGETWTAFPHDPVALAEAQGTTLDGDLRARLAGLAGITPTFTGNWTVPDDADAWDASGTGGISGAGGEAFDLAAVGLPAARFLRITDGESHNGAPGPADGFDLDAVVALHGVPLPPLTADLDGDRLPDAAEVLLYGTNPADPDSDGDGVDDGREAAACRDPASASSSPVFPPEPGLWVLAGGCNEVRWTTLGAGRSYDLVRGELAALADPGMPDLGTLACLADDSTTLRWSCDGDLPGNAEGWFYLVRDAAAPDYGHGSSLGARLTVAGCP